MSELRSSQRKWLRGLAHPLEPIVRIGKHGATEGVLSEIDAALDIHELVKVQAPIPREEKGDLGQLERDVVESLAHDELLSQNIEAEIDEHRTMGERASDVIASFGGSWTFILSFCAFIVVWMCINIAVAAAAPFDPYPFILLNLVLSCVAALQAPVIMMSQRRQEAKDRLRSENDYRVNLKAELEIRNLHEKIDHMLTSQWQRLAEIQSIQIELMEDLVQRRR